MADQELYDANQAREVFINEVVARGDRIVVPTDQELQVDIDSEDAYTHFLAVWEGFKDSLSEHKYPPSFASHPSRSGLPRRHITVTLPYKLSSSWERIALQQLLGSDPVRERMNCYRCLWEDTDPVLFTEPGEPK